MASRAYVRVLSPALGEATDNSDTCHSVVARRDVVLLAVIVPAGSGLNKLQGSNTLITEMLNRALGPETGRQEVQVCADAIEIVGQNEPRVLKPRPVLAESAACSLTPHELRLLKLLVAGHRYKTAAAELGVSPNTVSFHLRRVYQKLGVHSKAEAVSKALRLGLV